MRRCFNSMMYISRIFFFFAILAILFYGLFLVPIKDTEDRNKSITNMQRDMQLLKDRVEELEVQIDNINIITNSFSFSPDAIFSFLTYYNPKLDKEYASAFSELATSLMSDRNMVEFPSVFLIALATMGVESGFQLDARNPDSSARGLGQIIYHYHPWLADYDISQDDLTTHLEKSMYATYLVLLRYWQNNNFSYKKMLFNYRGRKYDAYYSKIMEYTVFLTARIIHTSIKEGG